MPRQPRTSSGTGIYHVMLRGNNRQDIFEEQEDFPGKICVRMHIQTSTANESLLRGVEDMQFKDIEDSCQYQAAVAAGCDFKSKSYIALKEARESLYWLELLHRNNYLDDKQFQSIYNDYPQMSASSH